MDGKVVITGRGLRLKDVVVSVNMQTPPWNQCMVIGITENGVILYRPYVRASDTVMRGVMIPYIGHEQWTVPFDHEFILLYREGEQIG